MRSPPVRFFIPLPESASGQLPTTLADYWPWISAQSQLDAWGPFSWTLQTFLQLSAFGFPCELAHELPDDGIVVAHRDFLAASLKPNARTYLVCILADREQPGLIGHHPFAQFHIVQNPDDPKLRSRSPLWPASYLPYWSQPGLIPRDRQRGDRFDTVGYLGYPQNLAPELQVDEWAARLQPHGFRFSVPHRSHWHDYSAIDVILAVRKFGAGHTFSYKPPSKLINAWRAGVPAILGNESAYRALRQSDRDYIEVHSLEQAFDALCRLRDDRGLRRAMVEHGDIRAQAYDPKRIAECWQSCLVQEVRRAHDQWCAASSAERAQFLDERERFMSASASHPGQRDDSRTDTARARPASPHQAQCYELAIIGSGFAAFALARRCGARGVSTLVIEKGEEERTASSDALSAIPYRREPIVNGSYVPGAPMHGSPDALARCVALGGSSELWAGKWRRMDRIDFERPHDGRRWPFPASTLAPFYDEVTDRHGWPDWSRDARYSEFNATVQAHGLRFVEVFEESPPSRLRPRWRELQRTGAVEIACRSAVTQAAFDSTGRTISSLRVRQGGDDRLVEARRVVVACGGVESVGVSHLLRSSSSRPKDALGMIPLRYGGFMDHPKGRCGVVVPAQGRSLVNYLRETRSEFRRLLAFSLPEAELEARRLGNHTVMLWESGESADGQHMTLVISLEQFPDNRNFVLPGPTTSVSWRISERTRKDGEAFLRVFVPRLSSLLGPIRLDDIVEYRGASHHMGALAMGDADATFVDRDCRFHDVDNLYCVSSAVFPIAGSANPTLTIVALASRLAVHLFGDDHA